MNKEQIALLVVTPLIVATGVMLWRERALSTFGLIAASAVAITVASFLFLTL